MKRFVLFFYLLLLGLTQLYSQSAVDYYEIGKSFFKSKEYAKAIEAFKEAHKICDNNMGNVEYASVCEAVRFNLGLSYFHDEKYHFAISTFSDFLNEFSEDDQAWNLRGLAYLNTSKTDDAISDFSEALRLNPIPEYYFNLAQAYHNSDKCDYAIRTLDEGIKEYPNDFTFYNMRGNCYTTIHEFSLALADYLTADRLSPNNSVILTNIGKLYEEQNNCLDAIEYYQKAIQSQPLPSTKCNLAYCMMKLYRFKAANDVLNEVIEESPKFAFAHFLKGKLLILQGDYPNALKSLDYAGNLDEKNREVWVQKALAYYHLNYYDEGLGVVNHVLESDPNHSSVLSTKALLLLETNKFEAAKELLIKANEVQPQNPILLATFGRYYFLEKNYSKAKKYLDQAILLEPNNSLTLYWRSCLFHARDDYDSAKKDLNLCLDNYPIIPNAFALRGKIYYESGNQVLAYQDLLQAIDLNNRSIIANYYLGQLYHEDQVYDDALKCFDKVILIKADEAEYYIHRAETHLALGNYHDATTDAKIATRLNPNSEIAYYNQAKALSYYDVASAIEATNKAISISPNNPSVHFLKGQLNYQSQNYSQAVLDLTRSIALSEDFMMAYYYRALAYTSLGHKTETLMDYEKTIVYAKLEDDNDFLAKLYQNKGVIHHQFNEQQKAIQAFEEAISYNPNDPNAYENLALVQQEIFQYAASIENFDIAIKLKIGQPEPYYNRGISKCAMKDYEGAEKDINKAISLSNNNPKAKYYHYRGVVRYNQENFVEASQDFGMAISINNDDAEPHYYLGMMQHQNREYEQAIAYYDEAVRIDQGKAHVFEARGDALCALLQYENGITDYNSAIDLPHKYNEDLARLYQKKGYAYYEKAQTDNGSFKDYSLAAASYDQAITKNEYNPEAWHGRGKCRFELKQYYKAIEDYTKAISLFEGHQAEVYVNRGFAYLKTNQPNQACEDFSYAKDAGYNDADILLARNNCN